MRLSYSSQPDFFKLLWLVCEGRATAAERAQFEQRMLIDDEAADAYLLFQALQTDLAWRNQTAPEQDRDPASQRGSRTIVLGFLGRTAGSLNRPLTLSIFSVGVLFAIYAGMLLWDLRSGQLPNGTDGNASSVAVLGEAEGVRWSKATAPKASHADIRSGEKLAIDSGLIELQLKQGTTLVIEGPAEWSIDGANNATLKHGKLLAKVPKQAIGFTLEIATARIIDLGTEFGVEVDQGGDASVHVLTGEIDVQGAGGAGKPGPGIVRAGQSVQIRKQGATVGADSAIAEKFKQLAEAGKSDKPSRPPVQSNRYAECVKALKPLVYFPVDRGDGLAISDLAQGKYLGKFTRTAGAGEGWEKGPFGDALHFRGPKYGDRVTVVPKDSAADVHPLTFSRGSEPGLPFTIALWARCQSGLHGGLLVGKGGGFQSQFLLDVVDGRYRFVLHSASGKSNGIIHSQAVCDGTWQHVTAVFDPKGKSIALYVNGVSSAAATLKDTSLLPTTEPVSIGNRDFPGNSFKLTLDGAVDEIALFDRVLSASEIHNLYRLQPTN